MYPKSSRSPLLLLLVNLVINCSLDLNDRQQVVDDFINLVSIFHCLGDVDCYFSQVLTFFHEAVIRLIEEKERIIKDGERIIAVKDSFLSDKERLISDKERIIADKERLISGKDSLISHLKEYSDIATALVDIKKSRPAEGQFLVDC
jgi:hypothetical protein